MCSTQHFHVIFENISVYQKIRSSKTAYCACENCLLRMCNTGACCRTDTTNENQLKMFYSVVPLYYGYLLFDIEDVS